MGRTLPTFTQRLADFVQRWAPFRRALRKRDQEAFDALVAKAKQHVAEAAYASPEDPFQAIVLAILVEQEKTLQDLQPPCQNPREPGEPHDPPPVKR